ncbi:MAG TPA: phosphatase PAP2 family protein, partial [Chloroflexota bacterium]|nr:phosphatase PAP2 family protein [Chloroflexota bacterium]
MKFKFALPAIVLMGLLTVGAGAAPTSAGQVERPGIESRAGSWHTWVLASASEVRPGVPPDAAGTASELDQLRALAAQRDAAALDDIAFWDTGAPSYRWNELAVNAALKRNFNSNYGTRALALLHVALSDSMVATWDAKYTYQRPRPSELDQSMVPLVSIPASPSYPSEHAAAAAAASAVLTYLFPDDAQLFADKAEEASRSRVMAGVQYPSDIVAGQELGRGIAARVIDWAQHDESDAQWTGSIPTEPG